MLKTTKTTLNDHFNAPNVLTNKINNLSKKTLHFLVTNSTPEK